MRWRLPVRAKLLPMVLCVVLLVGCGGGTGNVAQTPATQPTDVAHSTAVINTTSVPMATAALEPTDAPEETMPAEQTASPPAGRATVAPADASGASGEAAGCDQAYFPLRTGASWTYKTSGIGQASEYTQVVEQVSDEGAEITFKVNDVTISNEVVCTPEGIRLGRLPTISSEQAGGFSAQFEPQTVEGVYLLPEAELVPGATWDGHYVMTGKMNVAGQQMEMNNDMTLAFEVVGTETVTVPAGTFEALKIKQQITSKATVKGGPVDVPAITFDQFVWFAKGVGMVKSSGSIANAGEVTTELQNYTIP